VNRGNDISLQGDSLKSDAPPAKAGGFLGQPPLGLTLGAGDRLASLAYPFPTGRVPASLARGKVIQGKMREPAKGFKDFSRARDGNVISLPEARDDVALAGADGKKAAGLLQQSVKHGTATLGTIAEAAVKRLLAIADPLQADSLFTDAERQELAQALAATNGTAELLGRARIRLKGPKGQQALSSFASFLSFASFDERPIQPLTPTRALAYFKRLVPGLFPESKGFDEEQKRRGFTLAVSTEQTLLERIQDLITEALRTGRRIRQTPQDIDQLLDDAGVTPNNPQYAEMLVRTNMMESFRNGAMAELREPDMQEEFPVWRYVGIRDGRQRPAHQVHFDKYYSSLVDFAEVRDSVAGEFDGYNCRCDFIPISKNQWKRLQEQGAQVQRFAEGFDSIRPSLGRLRAFPALGTGERCRDHANTCREPARPSTGC
jgi:hypothetical protein